MKHLPVIIIANIAQFVTWKHIEPVLKGLLLFASLVYTVILIIEHWPKVKKRFFKRRDEWPHNDVD